MYFSNTALISPIVRAAFGNILSENSHVLAKAVDTVCSFNEDERVSLLDLLENHLKRHADQKFAYKAYVELITKDVPGSIASYVNALSNMPVESIYPAMAFDMAKLFKDKPDVKTHFAEIIERFTSKRSKIKTAFEKALDIQKPEKG